MCSIKSVHEKTQSEDAKLGSKIALIMFKIKVICCIKDKNKMSNKNHNLAAFPLRCQYYLKLHVIHGE